MASIRDPGAVHEAPHPAPRFRFPRPTLATNTAVAGFQHIRTFPTWSKNYESPAPTFAKAVTHREKCGGPGSAGKVRVEPTVDTRTTRRFPVHPTHQTAPSAVAAPITCIDPTNMHDSDVVRDSEVTRTDKERQPSRMLARVVHAREKPTHWRFQRSTSTRSFRALIGSADIDRSARSIRRAKQPNLRVKICTCNHWQTFKCVRDSAIGQRQ